MSLHAFIMALAAAEREAPRDRGRLGPPWALPRTLTGVRSGDALRLRRPPGPRRSAQRAGGRRAARARGPGGLDDRAGQGGRAQPPRPVVAAWRRAPGEGAADDPGLRRRRDRRGRQRGRRPRRRRVGRLARATRRSTPSARCSPRGTRARWPSGSPCRGQPDPQARGALLRAGRLPADRVADRLPDALHPRGGHARLDRARPGRRAAASPPRAIALGAAAGVRVWATSRSEEKRAARARARRRAGLRARRAAARARRRGDRDRRRGDVGPLGQVAQARRRDRRLRRDERRRPARRSSPACSSCSCGCSARRWAPGRSSRGWWRSWPPERSRPTVDRTLPLADAREGFAAMAAGELFGKVVLEV